MVLPLILGVSLAEWVAAFVIMILLWASSELLVKPLTIILSRLPVIGGAVADAVRQGGSVVVDWAAGWIKTAGGPMVEVLAAPVARFVDVILNLVTTVETIVGHFDVIVSWAWGRIQDVANFADTIWARVGALGVSLAASAARLASLSAEVAGIVAGTIPRAIAAVLAQAETTARYLVDLTAVVLSAAIHTALATALAAVAAESAALTAARGDLLKLIAGQGAVLTAAIAAAVATVRAEVGVQVRTLERDIADLHVAVDPLAAAGVLTLISTLTTELDTMRRECVDPVCNVLTPSLGALSGLAEMGTLLAVLELAGAAIRDPQGTADDVAGGVAAVHGLVRDVAGPVLGVAV